MPNTQTVPLTQEKYAQLQAERRRLTKERAEVMQRLQTAREMGDLSENGAYKYAKFELGSIGRALRNVNYLLAVGVVTPKQMRDGAAGFGCRVTLRKGVQERTYLLVSEHESDPAACKISLTSPIGQAVFGKHTGAVIQVKAPAGITEYTIVHIE